jgi:predicted ATPase/transcriptional regulator with XRE-family HTH domain
MVVEHEAGPFGHLLHQYRATAGLSQEELAERAGLGRRGISDLERGMRRTPYPATVRRLVKALGLGQTDRAALVAAARTNLAGARAHDATLPANTPESSDRGVSRADRTTGMTERRHHNLPVALTTFIGRGPELIQLQELLSKTRLVTLVGVGGAGKTRLALEVAAHVVDSFAHGVWLVELADVSDPMLVPQRVVIPLELRDDSGQRSREVLIEYLRPRQVLLVLDNCEHLIEVCADLVQELLSACAELKILATSREPLGITGELAWRIPPLSTPTSTVENSMERLVHYDAVQLLVVRAANTAGVALTDEHCAAIAEVCRRLDGLPLALELAAARLRTLAPQQVAERLQDRFKLLIGGSRSAPPRHQTLRATLEWSYGLLAESERLVFDRASVFAGGCTLPAAEAVCAGDGIESSDVLDLLTSLVDKSLVQAEPGAAGEARYRLLETLRQYGHEQLTRRAAVEATRRRHAAYFLAEAELAEPELRGPHQQLRLWRLNREYDNFRAALGWAIDCGDAELGLRLAAALAEFWRRRGYIGEGQRWLERALAQAPDAPPAVRAEAWYGAGNVARLVYSDVAERFFAESLALRRQLDDKRGIAESLAGLATAGAASSSQLALKSVLDELAAGEHAAALNAQLEFNSAHNRRDSIWSSSLWSRRTGHQATATPASPERRHDDRATRDKQGQIDRLFEESLGLFRSLEDSWGIASCLTGMGNLAFVRGDYPRAAVLMEEGLDLARAHGDAWQAAYLLHGLGHLTWLLGDRARSVALLADGLVLCGEIGDQRGAATCLQSFALMAGNQGLWEQAARLWGGRRHYTPYSGPGAVGPAVDTRARWNDPVRGSCRHASSAGRGGLYCSLGSRRRAHVRQRHC